MADNIVSSNNDKVLKMLDTKLFIYESYDNGIINKDEKKILLDILESNTLDKVSSNTFSDDAKTAAELLNDKSSYNLHIPDDTFKDVLDKRKLSKKGIKISKDDIDKINMMKAFYGHGKNFDNK